MLQGQQDPGNLQRQGGYQEQQRDTETAQALAEQPQGINHVIQIV